MSELPTNYCRYGFTMDDGKECVLNSKGLNV